MLEPIKHGDQVWDYDIKQACVKFQLLQSSWVVENLFVSRCSSKCSHLPSVGKYSALQSAHAAAAHLASISSAQLPILKSGSVTDKSFCFLWYYFPLVMFGAVFLFIVHLYIGSSLK